MEAQDKHILGISALVIILVIGLMFTCGGLWNDNVKLKKQLSEAQNKPAQIITNTIPVPAECPKPIVHPVISRPSLPETPRQSVSAPVELIAPAEPIQPALKADKCPPNLVSGSCNLWASGCLP